MAKGPTKTQRWIDLIACLLARRTPVTVDEIFRAVPGYGQANEADGGPSADSQRRKFERDKDELRELGIPIDTVTMSTSLGRETSEAYRLRPNAFYLPRLPGEQGSTRRTAAEADGPITMEDLQLALDALRETADIPDFPLADEARSAFRKLSFHLGEIETGVPVRRIEHAGAGDVRGSLSVLADALLRRKSVTFRYHGLARGEATDRSVAPYGLVLQHGAWYLVGHDDGRGALRMFHVGRMERPRANTSAPATPDFDVPPDFDLANHRGKDAWQLPGAGETVEARVRFTDAEARWADRNALGTLDADDDRGAVRRFAVSLPLPFLGWLLGRRGRSELLGPPDLVQRLADLAAGIRDAHAPGGEA